MKKRGIIIVLCVISLCMGIGYSVLSKQLKIEGTVNTGKNFDVQIVGIEKLNEVEGIGGTPVMISGKAVEVSEPTFTSNSASFNVRLDVNSSITYLVKVQNKGTLSADIKNLETVLTGNKDINVKILNDVENKILPYGKTVVLAVQISYPYREDLTEYTDPTSVKISFQAQQTQELENFEEVLPSIFLINQDDTASYYQIINDEQSMYDLYLSVDDNDFVKLTTEGSSSTYYSRENNYLNLFIGSEYKDGENHSYKLKLVNRFDSTLTSNEIDGGFCLSSN